MALTKVTGSVIKDSVSLSGNVSVGGTLTYQDVTNVDALGVGTFRSGINVSGGQLDVGSNIKLGNAGVITATSFSGVMSGTTGSFSGQVNVGSNIKLGTAGVVTATSFVGSGANLTSLPAANLTGTLPAISGANLTSLPAQATIANNADNRIITGGSGVNLNGESTFTYGGSAVTLANANPQIRLTDTDDSKNFDMVVSGGNGFFSANSSGMNMVFEVTGSERLRIASDGKITVAANSDIRFTNGTWTGEVAGKIQQNSNNLYIQGGTGGIRFRHASSGVNQFSMTNGGNFEITNGDLVVASGHGIDFSATGNAGNSASMSNEILDDYEEGSWTPYFGVAGGASGQAFSTQEGTYTKIGNRVFCTFHIQLSNKGTQGGAGWVTLTNLPFAISGIGGGGSANYWDSFTSSFSPTVWRCMQGGTSVYIAKANGNTSTDLNIAQLTNSSRIYGSLYYHTNDM